MQMKCQLTQEMKAKIISVNIGFGCVCTEIQVQGLLHTNIGPELHSQVLTVGFDSKFPRQAFS